MGSNPIGALYKHCSMPHFFSSRILRNMKRENIRCIMKHFFSKADHLFAIFSSLKISVEVACVQTPPSQATSRKLRAKRRDGKKRDPGVGFITDPAVIR